MDKECNHNAQHLSSTYNEWFCIFCRRWLHLNPNADKDLPKLAPIGLEKEEGRKGTGL